MRESSAQEAAGEEQHHKQRNRRHDEGRKLAGRSQEFAGDDQEDRAQRGTEHGATSTEYSRDDHVHSDRDVDDSADRGGAEREDEKRAGEAGEKRADDEGGEFMLDDVEAERAGLHRVLAA